MDEFAVNNGILSNVESCCAHLCPVLFLPPSIKRSCCMQAMDVKCEDKDACVSIRHLHIFFNLSSASRIFKSAVFNLYSIDFVL